MSEESREKYWQEKAGRLATVANWALHELIDAAALLGKDNEVEQANDYLNEIIPFLDFDEDDE